MLLKHTELKEIFSMHLLYLWCQKIKYCQAERCISAKFYPLTGCCAHDVNCHL